MRQGSLVSCSISAYLGEHALQTGPRDLVAPLDDRRGAVERGQPDAVGNNRIGGIGLDRRVARLLARAVRRGLAVIGIDRQKECVGGRQRTQLCGVSSGQRAVAGKPPHQLVARFERRRSQLRLQEAPEHPGVLLDQIDGRQQRRPMQLAAESQLQVVRLRQLVEIYRPVQPQAASSFDRPHGDHRRFQRILIHPANQNRHARGQQSELIRRRNAVERIGQLPPLRADEAIAGAFDDRRPGGRLAHGIWLGGIREQRANARVHARVIGHRGV